VGLECCRDVPLDHDHCKKVLVAALAFTGEVAVLTLTREVAALIFTGEVAVLMFTREVAALMFTGEVAALTFTGEVAVKITPLSMYSIEYPILLCSVVLISLDFT
jgi:hypothetical protein